MSFEVSLPLFVQNIEVLDIHQQFLLAAGRGLLWKINSLIDAETLNPDCCDNNGFTALHLAASRGYSDIVKALLDSPRINYNALDKLGRHAIELAWKRNNKTIVELIYKKMRTQIKEPVDEFGLVLFSQMLFSDPHDIFGRIQDLQELKAISNQLQGQINQITNTRNINGESCYWLEFSENDMLN
jgi:hypothetical protein